MTTSDLIDISTISSRTINLKRSPYIFIVCKPEKREEYEKDGWQFEPSRLKKSIRMKKAKPHNEYFEDKVWALFAKMRFSFINNGNSFKLHPKGGLPKQIDVFTAEDEAILIVECKSTEARRRVSYQKDINEIIGLKSKLYQAAQDLLSGKQKIAFIFATNNAIISDNDRQRLADDNIFHFNQDDIKYFEQLTDLLGFAAKYQLYGKLFEGQKIPGLKNLVPAIKGKVTAGHTFYSFSIDPYDLLKIGFVLHRVETNPESAIAYQRLIKKPRLNQIGKYINNKGYFPNSIIININTKKKKDLQFDLASSIQHDSSTIMGVLHLPQTYKSAFIIDGQHRLYGYAVTESQSHHTIPVVAFINLPAEEQAKIFVDINHTQRSVPANLLHSIMADFHWNSANDKEAISALKTRLFVELNSDDRSPFYQRIILSEEKKDDIRCLTLQTIKSWGLNKVEFFGKLKGDKLVKTGYLSDVDYNTTLKKAICFFNHIFKKIEEDLPAQWKLGSSPGGFIAMNIGVSSLIRILNSIIEYQIKFKNLKPENLAGEDLAEKLFPYIKPIIVFVKELDSEAIKKIRSYFGSGATEKLVREFENVIHQEYPDFNPEGLEQWMKENTGEFNAPAHEIGHNYVEPMIDKFIKMKLKEQFGENWWSKGIPKTIQIKCTTTQIEADSVEPPYNFLNTIDYLDIIKANFSFLGVYFTRPGEEGKKKETKLDWLKRFNKIRQKYSHPQRENTTEEEYNYLVQVKEWLEKSLE